MRWQEDSKSCEDGEPRPTWWLLYCIGSLLVATLGLVEVRVADAGLREVLDILAVVGGFGLIGLWVRHNRVAFELSRGRRRS
jgi:hypothetical protein